MPDLPLDFSASYSLAYQAAIVAHLRSSAKIAVGLDVLGKVEGSLETRIDEALAGAVGATIFVSPPLPGGISPDVSAIVFDRFDFVVRIIQDTTTDDSGKTAHLLMEIVLARLHHFTPRDIPGAGVITADPDPVDARATTKKRIILDLGFSGAGSFGLDESLGD
ncbi:MAG: hypothetical protein WC205_16940 [Opitutaceae bacterium]|jgi:hypothetical protein